MKPKERKEYRGEEAKRLMPYELRMKLEDVVIACKERVIECLEKKHIPFKIDPEPWYSYSVYPDGSMSFVYYAERLDMILPGGKSPVDFERNIKRYIEVSCSWKEGIYRIDLAIHTELTGLWDDYKVPFFQYVKVHNPGLLRMLEGIALAECLEQEFIEFLDVGEREFEENMERLKAILLKIIDWVLAQEEIEKMLRGEVHLRGYVPPSPY